MKRFALLILLGSLLTLQSGCGHRRACCRCYTCSCAAPCVAQDQDQTQPEPAAAEPVEAEQDDYDVAFRPDDLQLNQPVPPRQYY